MAYQPMGAAPRASDPQKTAMIISAVIGALALVGVLLILITSGTSSERVNDGPPGGQQGIQGTQGLGSNDGSNNGSNNGAAASGGSTSRSALRPAVPASYLRTHFPVPPGSTTYPKPEDVPSGEVWFVNSKASLASVKAYYDKDPFTNLGLQYELGGPIKGNDGSVIGYTSNIRTQGQYGRLEAGVQFRHRIEGLPADTVLIQATFF